jgi:hypothetical protein
LQGDKGEETKKDKVDNSPPLGLVLPVPDVLSFGGISQ